MASPYFANLTKVANVLGVSKQTVYRLIRAGKLKEGKHYSRFTDNGSMMFYLPEVIAALKPEQAKYREE